MEQNRAELTRPHVRPLIAASATRGRRPFAANLGRGGGHGPTFRLSPQSANRQSHCRAAPAVDACSLSMTGILVLSSPCLLCFGRLGQEHAIVPFAQIPACVAFTPPPRPHTSRVESPGSEPSLRGAENASFLKLPPCVSWRDDAHEGLRLAWPNVTSPLVRSPVLRGTRPRELGHERADAARLGQSCRGCTGDRHGGVEVDYVGSVEWEDRSPDRVKEPDRFPVVSLC
ncbi:hypothetical protein NL676_024986 [Syzygium grande]|nr:hypothetical protein NL676_024986 [Syzygium grande]